MSNKLDYFSIPGFSTFAQPVKNERSQLSGASIKEDDHNLIKVLHQNINDFYRTKWRSVTEREKRSKPKKPKPKPKPKPIPIVNHWSPEWASEYELQKMHEAGRMQIYFGRANF